MIELTALFNFYDRVNTPFDTMVDNFKIKIKHDKSGNFEFSLQYDEI